MKMLKRWISVCLVILLLAGVAFDHSSLIGSTVEAAGLEETDGAEPAETPDASEETSDVPSLLSEGDGADTPTPEEQAITNTETETEAPAEKTETKQEESTGPEKQAVTNSDTETKAPAEKTETKQEESTEPEKQAVTNKDNETKEPVTKTSDDVSKESVQPSAFKGKYEDDSIIINVSAEPGVVPEGAKLSVTPIEKTEITNDMTAEEKAEAEKINDQYDLTEKKLTEDSEKNEETMEGFLAYDISFLVDGEEVEPTGDVKVTMDFKEAAIPEGVSEDSEVSVKHLKEDETAEDGVIVEDMDSKSNVEITAQAEVKKVELTADQFSLYNIVWTQDKDNLRIDVKYYYYDGTSYHEFNAGNKEHVELGPSGRVNLEQDNKDEKIPANCNISGKNYVYTEARVDSTDGPLMTYIDAQYEDDGHKKSWQAYYGLPEGGYELFENSYEVVLIYSVSEIPTVPTVDSASKGISISMFNYPSSMPNKSTWGPYEYDNVEGKLKQGLLNKELVYNESSKEWLPVAKAPNVDLTSNFSKNSSYYVGEANRLFLESEYNNSEYYYYSAFENYAYLDQDEGPDGLRDFTVYDAIATPKDGDQYYYKRGNFLPFNDIRPGKFSTNNNLYNEDGTKLDPSDSEYGKRLYKPVEGTGGDLNEDGIDFYFGMKIEADFTQPVGGKIDGEDMVFEFNGDDDMWVFIDGVLVLDLGGVHDAHSGKINFRTGVVEWTDCAMGDTPTTFKSSIKEAFDGTSKKDTTQWNGNTFADYTSHNIQIFYMERGDGASNCKIKFNIQTIPKGQIQVKKHLNTETDPVKYGNVQFGFKLFVENADEDGQGTGKYTQVTKQNLGQYEAVFGYDSNNTSKLTMYGDGIFYLKPEQTAYFNKIPQNLKYYVQEVDVRSEEYDEVSINGEPFVEEDKVQGSSEGYFSYSSTEDTVANRHIVAFTNACSANNMRTLRIDKKMEDGQSLEEEFRIKIELENSEGNLSPYSGKYWIFNSNVTDGESSTEQGEEETTTDGYVKLKAGQYICIYNILSETQFKVSEDVTNLPADVYNDPKYSVSVDGRNPDPVQESFAQGEIQLGHHAKVVVENSLANVPDSPYLEVQKTFEGLTQEEINSLKNFKILINNKSNSQRIATLTLDGGISDIDGVTIEVSNPETTADGIVYTWKIYNIGEGEYYVVGENEQVLNNYKVTTTVNGDELNTSVEIKKPTFNVTQVGDGDGKIPQQGTSEFVFNDLNVIVISFKGNNAGYLVWTEDTLSVSERKELIKSIAKEGTDQFDETTLVPGNKVFFSTRDIITAGFDYRGHLSVNKDGKLNFEATKQWDMIWAGRYTKQKGVNAEIEVLNSYEPEEVIIDLQKYGSEYVTQREGAEFSLFAGTYDNENLTWSQNPVKGYENFKVSATETDELKLKPGYYMLKETKAPSGFVMLNEAICFKVDSGEVRLIDQNGKEIQNSENLMWKLQTGENDTFILKIKNNALYNLPSSGGPGIYWYTIGGMLLMMAGSLILYKNKRREVLERK